MIKKLATISLSCACAAVLATAHAGSHGGDGKPKVSYNGSLGFKLNIQDSNDSWEMKNTKARLGVNVMQDISVGKLIGQFEVDYDNASNNTNQSDGTGDADNGDELDIRNARVVWKVPGDHTLVFAGRSPSGNFADNYAHLDIFDGGGYHYFQQGSHTGKLIGYKSPTFNGIHVGAAIFSTTPANDEDQDVVHFRVVWNSGPWHVGYGHVESNTSTADDSTREAVSFSYTDGPLKIAMTHEDKLLMAGTADGDTVLGVAASYTSGVHTFRGAVYSQDSDNSTNDGLSATTLEYSHALNKYANAFVTIDQFDVTDSTDDDATVFGINMKW
jgi:predicted porin